MTALSYLGAHWMLFIIVVLSVVLLGAAAWFLKNWKYAAAAVVLTILGFAYQSANIDGYKRKAAEDAMAQLTVLKSRLGTLQLTQALDAQRAQADVYLNTQLETLSRDTPRNDSACLDISAARRVWAIGSAKSVTAPLPTRRSTSVLPWRHSRP